MPKIKPTQNHNRLAKTHACSLHSIILSLLFFWSITFFCQNVNAATYYVRTDGGTLAQCSGLVDAAQGVDDPNCALKHPWLVHGPTGGTDVGFTGGDIMVFSTTGGTNSYNMGYDGGQNVGSCSQSSSWDCYMQSIPAGSSGSPTIIRGDTWDSSCTSPPELWGSGNTLKVLNMDDSDWVELRCLEVTDHSSCVDEIGSTDVCSRNWSGGGLLDARNGIMGKRADNVIISDVNIHGMSSRGMLFGQTSNVTMENSTVRGNPIAGWDLDHGNVPNATGDMSLDNVTVEYNGCHEDYPIVSGLEVENCFGQDVAGGYGDGIGSNDLSGDWVITDSDISHNTSDGLDLLYISSTGSVTIKRSLFEGNAGNQVKTATETWLEDNVIIGNCAYMEDQGLVLGSWGSGQTCRAGGAAVDLSYSATNQTMTSIGNTIIGQGDIIFTLSQRNYACSGAETFNSSNTIYVGANDESAFGPDNQTAFVYTDECSGVTTNYGSSNSNIVYHLRNSPCTDSGFICPDADPELNITFGSGNGTITCSDVHNCDATPSSGTSPVVGAGENATGDDNLDYSGNDRGATHDIGAIEFSTSAPDCSDDCSLCGTQGACEASAAFDCNGTGFCCWNTSVCEETLAASCDSDHCDLCATQTPCEDVANSLCTWNGSSCEATVISNKTIVGGTWYGNI